MAKRIENTRSAAAVELWDAHLDGAIVAIGNAPTALMRLIELVEAQKARPALIIGLPVGFVNAAESKATPVPIKFIPIFVVIISYFWLDESIRLLNVLCTLGAFGGVAVLTLGMLDKDESKTEYDYPIIGVLLEMMCAVSFGTVVCSLKQLSKRGVPHIYAPFYMGLALVALCPFISLTSH